MELTDKEIMDAMPKQLHEDLAKMCQMASDSIGVDVAGMFRVCLNRGIVDHCRAAIAAHQTAMPAFPPQELTDAQLDALERQHWKVESNIEYEPGAGFAEALDKHETFQHRAFARAAIAADRAANTPSPSHETR